MVLTLVIGNTLSSFFALGNAYLDSNLKVGSRIFTDGKLERQQVANMLLRSISFMFEILT